MPHDGGTVRLRRHHRRRSPRVRRACDRSANGSRVWRKRSAPFQLLRSPPAANLLRTWPPAPAPAAPASCRVVEAARERVDLGARLGHGEAQGATSVVERVQARLDLARWRCGSGARRSPRGTGRGGRPAMWEIRSCAGRGAWVPSLMSPSPRFVDVRRRSGRVLERGCPNSIRGRGRAGEGRTRGEEGGDAPSGSSPPGVPAPGLPPHHAPPSPGAYAARR